MKGIYLTQESKQEIETKITQLEKSEASHLSQNLIGFANMNHGFIDALKEILSSATILPVEESWSIVEKQTNMMDEHQLRFLYNKGVIIQPKQ
jgi:hypothetical protein